MKYTGYNSVTLLGIIPYNKSRVLDFIAASHDNPVATNALNFTVHESRVLDLIAAGHDKRVAINVLEFHEAGTPRLDLWRLLDVHPTCFQVFVQLLDVVCLVTWAGARTTQLLLDVVQYLHACFQ
jgi:hypothetical protein